MLYGDLKGLKQVGVLKEELEIIQEFIESLNQFQPGIVKINETIAANFINYEVQPRSTQKWEAHKRDIDLHYIIEGEEFIDLNLAKNLSQEPYHEEEDFYLLHGNEDKTIRLQKKQFLILFPDEPHRTGININSQKIKKIVFKIRK